MRKLFESPVFALILAVVVMFGSMLLSTKIRFGKKCADVCDEFYSQGSEASSVSAELRKFCAAAEKVALTAQQTGIAEADSVLQDVDELRNLLFQQTDDLGAVNALYQGLLGSTFSLETALARAELNDAQAETVSAAQHDAAAAKAAIDASPFNASAASFLKRYQKFPTVALAGMVGVNLPCAFN